jgi:hypothetical protein
MKICQHFPTINITTLLHPEGRTFCNPSLVILPNGERFVLLREIVTGIPLNSPHFVSSQHWLCHYDANNSFISCQSIHDKNLRQQTPEAQHGLEDGRLFLWKDQLWALFSGLHMTGFAYCNTMVLCRLEGDHWTDPIVLPSPTHQPREKNWMPWVQDNQLHWVYSSEPTRIFQLNKDQTVQEVFSTQHSFEKNTLPFMLSGSSQLIPWKQGYLAVTHRRRLPPLIRKLWLKHITKDPDYQRKKVIFDHHLMVYDQQLQLIKISAAFQFECDGIEFCAGLADTGDHICLSYGLMDREAKILTLTYANIESLLS